MSRVVVLPSEKPLSSMTLRETRAMFGCVIWGGGKQCPPYQITHKKRNILANSVSLFLYGLALSDECSSRARGGRWWGRSEAGYKCILVMMEAICAKTCMWRMLGRFFGPCLLCSMGELGAQRTAMTCLAPAWAAHMLRTPVPLPMSRTVC